jgi:pimeloyl-ACP methyl ester carboxylesterase/DNA-binding CsgD family transcriptional regulator
MGGLHGRAGRRTAWARRPRPSTLDSMDGSHSAQIRFCTTRDAVKIAYAVRGQGPVVVKTPNWMNHTELDAHSVVWRSWIERFERNRTLVRYDARGCGWSDRLPQEMSFATNQFDLDAVVDAAGLDTFVLYGASQGAAIAIEYAARNPDRVTHLVLCGAYLQGAWKRAGQPAARVEAATLLKLVELGWGRENSAFRQVFASQFIPDGTPEQLAAFDEIQRKTVTAQAAADLLRTFYDIDVVAAARRVRCPTLVLHAIDDARIPFEEGRRTACTIPQAELVPLQTRNHILLEQDPAWQQFFRELDLFMERHPARTAQHRKRRCDLPFANLTPAELRVLDLVASGVANREIAARLQIADKTVRNHMNHILSKLAADDRSQLIVLARDAGFGAGDSPCA